ncbi:MAG: hypothetical protein AAGH65_05340, partial [Pseudomonadota bacterium]
SSEGYALKLTNKGVGPARVRRGDLLLDAVSVSNLDAAILDTLGPDNAFSYDVYRSANPAPGVMSPDEEVILFGVPWEARTRALTEAWAGRVDVEICFCSVYDECWVANLNTGDPDLVEQC